MKPPKQHANLKFLGGGMKMPQKFKLSFASGYHTQVLPEICPDFRYKFCNHQIYIYQAY